MAAFHFPFFATLIKMINFVVSVPGLSASMAVAVAVFSFSLLDPITADATAALAFLSTILDAGCKPVVYEDPESLAAQIDDGMLWMMLWFVGMSVAGSFVVSVVYNGLLGSLLLVLSFLFSFLEACLHVLALPVWVAGVGSSRLCRRALRYSESDAFVLLTPWALVVVSVLLVKIGHTVIGSIDLIRLCNLHHWGSGVLQAWREDMTRLDRDCWYHLVELDRTWVGGAPPWGKYSYDDGSAQLRTTEMAHCLGVRDLIWYRANTEKVYWSMDDLLTQIMVDILVAVGRAILTFGLHQGYLAWKVFGNFSKGVQAGSSGTAGLDVFVDKAKPHGRKPSVAPAVVSASSPSRAPVTSDSDGKAFGEERLRSLVGDLEAVVADGRRDVTESRAAQAAAFETSLGLSEARARALDGALASSEQERIRLESLVRQLQADSAGQASDLAVAMSALREERHDCDLVKRELHAYKARTAEIDGEAVNQRMENALETRFGQLASDLMASLSVSISASASEAFGKLERRGDSQDLGVTYTEAQFAAVKEQLAAKEAELEREKGVTSELKATVAGQVLELDRERLDKNSDLDRERLEMISAELDRERRAMIALSEALETAEESVSVFACESEGLRLSYAALDKQLRDQATVREKTEEASTTAHSNEQEAKVAGLESALAKARSEIDHLRTDSERVTGSLEDKIGLLQDRLDREEGRAKELEYESVVRGRDMEEAQASATQHLAKATELESAIQDLQQKASDERAAKASRIEDLTAYQHAL